jgi:predicted amidohydrolase
MAVDRLVVVGQFAAHQCWSDPSQLKQNSLKIGNWYMESADEADLVVFPELALTGYIPLKGYDQAKKRALADVAARAVHEELPRLASVTAGRRASMVVGFMEATAMRFEVFNSVALLEDGEVAAVYRKIHLPVEENHYFVPGDQVVVTSSRVGRLALSICYDMLFPEVGRMAALQGAELMCVCSSWLGIANLRALGKYLPVSRALENQYHVVFANGVGELEARGRHWSLYGTSLVVTAEGEVVAQAGDGEEQLRASLPASALSESHGVFPVLRDRRPDVYAPLVAPLSSNAALSTRP